MPSTIGAVHRLSLSAVSIIAMLGIVSGSPLLLGAGLAGVASVLIAAPGYYATERGRLRRILVHGATAAVFAFAVLSFGRNRFDAVLIVLMLGVFNRSLLRAGHRDDLVVLGAASVLMAAATTVTPGLAFGLMLLAFVPTLLWALWTGMILGAAERLGRPGALAAVRARPVPGSLARLALAGLVATASGFGAVSVLPRFDFAPFLAAGAFAGLAGASDTMSMTTGGVGPTRDGQVVLRIEPEEGVPPGRLEGLYARMYVLDRFDGRRWSASETGRFGVPPRVGPLVAGARVVVERTELGRDHPVPAIGRDGPAPIRGLHVLENLAGTWITARPRSHSFSLRVDLGAEPVATPIPEGFAAGRLNTAVELPESLDPRVRALAARLSEGQGSPREKIRAVLAHFSRGYQYSLERLPGESEDPLVRFLFEAKQGHCELYAGAMAVLLRASGVPARVVTGYYHGAWSEVGHYQAFTREDAHAWVEAWDGAGWRWFDATPEDLRARRSETTAIARLRDLYDLADRLWYDYVVDFENEGARRAFNASLWRLHRFAISGDKLGAVLGALGAASGGGAGVAVLLALVFVPLLGLGLALHWLRRRKDPRSLGRRLRRLLGAKPDENLTLGALVARLPGELRALGADAVARYEALRFGGVAAEPEAMRALRAAVLALEQARRPAPRR